MPDWAWLLYLLLSSAAGSYVGTRFALWRHHRGH